jgi:hypothetical protein
VLLVQLVGPSARHNCYRRFLLFSFFSLPYKANLNNEMHFDDANCTLTHMNSSFVCYSKLVISNNVLHSQKASPKGRSAHGSERGDLASRRASVGMGAVMAASGLDERPWRGRRQRRALARQRRREQTLRPRQRQAAASSPPTNADEIPQVEKQGIFARSLSSKAKWLSTFPCLLESDSYCTGTFGEPNLLLQSLVEVSLRFCCGGWDILRPLSADMPVLAMQDATNLIVVFSKRGNFHC